MQIQRKEKARGKRKGKRKGKHKGRRKGKHKGKQGQARARAGAWARANALVEGVWNATIERQVRTPYVCNIFGELYS